LSSFSAGNAPGIGHAWVMRQVSAALKMQKDFGYETEIGLEAWSSGGNYTGYHVWPKMGYVFKIHPKVKRILKDFGFDDDDLVDTASFFQSNKTASVRGKKYPSNWNGMSPQKIWPFVVDEISRKELVRVKGNAKINEDSLNAELLRAYNQYKREELGLSSKSNDTIYRDYILSIGFSVHDIDLFDKAWSNIPKLVKTANKSQTLPSFSSIRQEKYNLRFDILRRLKNCSDE
jgi:hypothetical protein